MRALLDFPWTAILTLRPRGGLDAAYMLGRMEGSDQPGGFESDLAPM
jgi:hypothetical protein